MFITLKILRTSKMEKCIVLHNMVCYKYVYFLAHDITRWKKKNAGKVIVDIILPGDGGGWRI